MNLRNHKLAVAATGGGSLFFSDILTAGGASEYLVFADIPYSHEALQGFVVKLNNKPCSEGTARQIAVAAEQKSIALGAPAIGMGISCSLSKGAGERRGREHKFYIAASYQNHILVMEWVHKAQFLSRAQEERVVADYCRIFIQEFAKNLDDIRQLKNGLDFSVKNRTSTMESVSFFQPRPQYQRLFEVANGGSLAVVDSAIGGRLRGAKGDVCIYSGSFNPFHAGHEAILKESQRLFGKDNVFIEISISNFDKPPLDALEVEKRTVAAMKYTSNVLITNKPFLDDKHTLIYEKNKNIVFAVGFDTYERYCQDSIAKDFKFLVFKRGGKSINDKSPRIHPKTLDISIEESNMSSTEIRNNGKIN